jgi:hypothetical protein
MEAKDKLGRGKDGRDWGACLSTVGEGVSAWGWVQVVCISSMRLLIKRNLRRLPSLRR